MTDCAILTLTLNPALDITTHIDKVVAQRKLRCGLPRYDAGGGGINVSRAIKHLGGESLALVALGGASGTLYRGVLDASGIDYVACELSGETRSSLTVMEDTSGLQYRFLLPGPEQHRSDIDRLVAAVEEQLTRGFRYIILSGSITPGMPVRFYTDICASAERQGVRTIVDTSGEALRAALAARPYILRIDHIEAAELIDGSDMERLSVPETARAVVRQGLAEIAIITVDDEGAVVATAEECLQIRPPKVPVVSAVGAGDSFVGALAMGLERGWPLREACRYGVAAAASAVTTEATELCSRESTERFFAETADMVEVIGG